MFDHQLTEEEAKNVNKKKPPNITKKEVEEFLALKTSNTNQEEAPETDQEDMPKDVLFKHSHGFCPRCKQNSAREQLSGANEPLRFRCLACKSVSLMSDWTE